MKSTNQQQAALAHEGHKIAIEDLLGRIQKGLTLDKPATWQDAGDACRVRELLVEAAFALGQLTEDQAKNDHGITL